MYAKCTRMSKITMFAAPSLARWCAGERRGAHASVALTDLVVEVLDALEVDATAVLVRHFQPLEVVLQVLDDLTQQRLVAQPIT